MKKIAWNFVNNFSTRGLLFLFSLVIGNLMSPHDMGVFVSLMLFLTYAQMFFGYQLGPGIVHQLNVQASVDDRAAYYSAGMVLTWLLAAVAVLFSLGMLDRLGRVLHLSSYKALMLWVVPLIVIRMLREYFYRVLQADSLFKPLAVVNMLAALIQLGGCVVLLSLGHGLQGAIIALYLANMMALIVLLRFAATRHRLVWDREPLVAAMRDTMKFCGYIFIAAIVVFLDTKIDVFLVNYFLAKDKVAIYAYAIEFALILTMIGDTISQVNFPRLSKAFSLSEHREVREIYGRSIRMAFLAISFVAMAFSCFARDIIVHILPPHYLAMLPVLKVLLVGVVPFATLSAVGTMMTSKGKPIYDALPVAASLIANVLLSIWLIPRYGMIGAASATTFSFFMRVVLGGMVIEKHVETNFHYGRIFVAYVLFIVTVIFMPVYVSSRLVEALGIVLYLVLGWRFVLTSNDRAMGSSYFISKMKAAA